VFALCLSHIFLLINKTHDVHSQHTYSTFTAMICYSRSLSPMHTLSLRRHAVGHYIGWRGRVDASTT